MRAQAEWSSRLPYRDHQTFVCVVALCGAMAANTWLAWVRLAGCGVEDADSKQGAVGQACGGGETALEGAKVRAGPEAKDVLG